MRATGTRKMLYEERTGNSPNFRFKFHFYSAVIFNDCMGCVIVSYSFVRKMEGSTGTRICLLFQKCHYIGITSYCDSTGLCR